MLRATIALAAALSGIAQTTRAENQWIRNVKLSRRFFNPSLGERIGIDVTIDRSGLLSVTILDRDGFRVRTLVSGVERTQGPQSLFWDGRDDLGRVVADEAYSLKIDLDSRSGRLSYFPGGAEPGEVKAETTFFDRLGGTLGYRLSAPARVHLQAGSSRMDPATREWIGPCLKTIVNREPRSAGSVIDYWNGYDESGTIYVPDLPNFVFSLFATALPENAIIAVGNRQGSFLEQVAHRQGHSLLSSAPAKREHHGGLTTLEDVSPRLEFRALGAGRARQEPVWSVTDNDVELEVALRGPSSRTFERESGIVMVFLDDQPLKTVEPRPAPLAVSVRLPKLNGSVHRLTVNWVTDFGPVAANSILIRGKRPLAERKTGAEPAARASGGVGLLPTGRP